MFCHFENDQFPDGEFMVDEEGRTVHQRKPLHTINGALITPQRRTVPPAELGPSQPPEDE